MLAVWVVALSLRLLYLWQIHDAPFFDLRIGDAEAYHLWARRIADGDWLGEGVFYQAPLYPYFLALVYRILSDSIAVVRVIQAFVGAGSCTLLASAGVSLFGRRGAIAGIGLAIYPPALASWPTYAEARYNLGLALAAVGRSQEAAQEYRETLRLRPDDADAHIALGKTLITLNQPSQAGEHYQQGLALRPKDVKALVGLGLALTQLGRPEEAIEKYRLALELDPQDATAHNNLGWTLASQGRVAEAVPHFERALALNPDYGDARRNLDHARHMLSRP